MPMTPMRFLAPVSVAVLTAAWVGSAAADVQINGDQSAKSAQTERVPPPAVGIIDCAGPPRAISVRFLIGPDGYVLGPIDTGGLDVRTDADARRAVYAVRRAAPYAATYRGLRLTVVFKPKKTLC